MGIFDIFKKKKNNAYLAVFSAEWCGPSKRFIKEINQAGVYNYTYINVDDNPELSEKYGIRNIPTTILEDENGNIIKKWIGYDDEDPGQSQFVKYIKNGPYNVSPLKVNVVQKQKETLNHKNTQEADAIALLEKIIGTPEKPAKVENKKLQDGAVYTGEAVLLQNGCFLPHGYGKKIISKEVEMTGHWVNGVANGMCYLNMHFAMVTGHFVNNQPDGWCLSIEGGRGFVFGVFKKDDCVIPLGESVIWMMRVIDFNLRTSYKTGQIIVGEIRNNKAKGFFFMNNGDAYVGTDTDSALAKTGLFFKFTHDGYVQIGRFEKGVLKENVSAERVIRDNFADINLYKQLNLNKKYF